MNLRVIPITVFVLTLGALTMCGQTIVKGKPVVPEPPHTPYERGTEALKKGDFETAIYHYTVAINSEQNLAGAYAGRGAARRLKGDYEGALADLDQSIKLNSNVQAAFYSRAWLNLILKHGDEAYADATKLLAFNDANNLVFPSHVLIAYFGLRQARRDSDANTFLNVAIPKQAPTSWTTQILRYLKHEITDDQLINAASGNRAMVEARAYVGLDQSLSGRKESALVNLRWVVANTDKRAYEYALASLEIKRLESPQEN
jgi:lipoprotein NlpI